jgi:amidohydrolase
MDIQELKTLRKEIHAHPEVSGNEKETSQRIINFLKGYSPDEMITDLGGHGILATWDSGKSGPDLLFRAELDALPIQEENDFLHKSVNKGVAHSCGHDGHSTILCGLAQRLASEKPESGKVRLLFQPSEENGEGAKKVLEDPKFKPIQPDYVFALHNIPGYPLNEVIVKEGSFSAAVNSIVIKLRGKTSHAAEPENGINPAMALSEIIREGLLLSDNRPEREDMRLITPVYLILGEKAYGTSAGFAEIHLTLRCWNNSNLENLQEIIQAISAKIAKKHGLSIDFDYTQTFWANENDKPSVDIVWEAAEKKGFSISERETPFKWGEDFGMFTSKYRGCMFGLGAGKDCPAIHNPDYDFPEELIETGVEMFLEIIHQIHSRHV